MTNTTVSKADLLVNEVTTLVAQGDNGAALIAAARGWRDFPDATFGSKGATFEQLAVGIATRIPGAVATPAEPEAESASVAAVVPVSAVPVSAVPVSAVPISAVPVSAPAAAVAAPQLAGVVEIARTADEGTIIRIAWTGHLSEILLPLGWNWAKRGWFFLGDRDTQPNMWAIGQSDTALAAAGYTVVNQVRGDEPARVRKSSAKPEAAVRPRKPTRRQTVAQTRRPVSAAPVQVRQVSAPPMVPVSAPPVAPVSVVPVAAAGDPLSLIMQTLAAMQANNAAMQADIVALKSGGPAPVAAVAAVVPVSAPAQSSDDVLASLLSEELSKVLGMTWMLKVAPGASSRKTVKDVRVTLANTIGTWWPAQHKGNVTFGVYADDNHANVIHVRIKAAAGQITPGILTKQVVGVALTVHGIGGQALKSDLV